jgi:hypothetical protein
MSIKSVGYKSVTLQAKTYTTPSITVNSAGQITELVEQTIEADASQQQAIDDLNATIAQITSQLATDKELLLGLSRPKSLATNLVTYNTLVETYAKAQQAYNDLNPNLSTNAIVYSLSQDDFVDDDLGNGYSKLNPASIQLQAGFYNIDFNFMGVAADQPNKASSYFFRVSNQDNTVKGPCQSFQYGTWNNSGTTFVAFNGSMVFNVQQGVAQFDLLVPSTSGTTPISYKPPNPLPIGTWTQFPSSGDYTGLPAVEFPTSPNAIVITALRFIQ